MAKEMMKETANSVSKSVSPIRDDLETLKTDAREAARVISDDARVLARDVHVEGKKQLYKAEERAKEALDDAKVRGREQYAEIAQFVQNNPGQSLAIAFVGGIIASMLLGRRG